MRGFVHTFTKLVHYDQGMPGRTSERLRDLAKIYHKSGSVLLRMSDRLRNGPKMTHFWSRFASLETCEYYPALLSLLILMYDNCLLLSQIPILASSAGTKLPICAMKAIKATYNARYQSRSFPNEAHLFAICRLAWTICACDNHLSMC